MLRADRRDAAVLHRSPDDWSMIGAPLERWLEQAAQSLAFAIASAVAVIDFQTVVVDGAMPADVRASLVERIRTKIVSLELQGLAPVAIIPGTIGREARARGAACLPLLADFSRDPDVLFRRHDRVQTVEVSG